MSFLSGLLGALLNKKSPAETAFAAVLDSLSRRQKAGLAQKFSHVQFAINHEPACNDPRMDWGRQFVDSILNALED
jgi:hypothetical protein